MSVVNAYVSDNFNTLSKENTSKPEVKLWFLVFECKDELFISIRDDIRSQDQPSDMEMFLQRHGVNNIDQVPACKCSKPGCDTKVFDAIGRVLGLCFKCKKEKCAVNHSKKDEYWKHHHGNVADALCKCCRASIRFHNYSAAHIIAVHYGGMADNTNIVPTCKSCNVAMGTTDLNVFTKELDRIRDIFAVKPELIDEVERRWVELANLPRRSLSG